MAKWWQFWKIEEPRRAPGASTRQRLPSGRVTQDKDAGYLPGMMVLAPPASIDDSWHVLHADRAFLERMSPARLLEVLSDLSPEVSRAYWDFLRLCNPGWEATANRVSGTGKETQHPQAQAALDAFLDTLDDQHGAVDVVFGQLFTGAFLRGALFGELVMDASGRVPLDLVTPDPISVRFRRVNDPGRGPVWQAGQWQGGQFVAFDRPTVRYTPIDAYPGSPYGRPLAAPALFVSLFLLAMLHDIRRVVQQQGYPRLDLEIDSEKVATILEQHLDDPTQYQAEFQAVVDQVIAAYADLEPDDAYVHTDVVTVNRPVGAVDAGSLGAVDGLIAALERMATRALKSMPIMMGLSESNTETQANRQWELYAAGIKSIQHYAETMLERLLTLALEAQGFQARVTFRFAELRAAEMLRDAQVETMQIANARAKYDHGYISQDQASEEITGEPADVPEPRVAAGGFDFMQDDGDGSEALNQGSDRETGAQPHRKTPRPEGTRGARVKLIPDGADDPPLPLPDQVTISDSELDRAIDEWDALMPDYAGLLEAALVGQVDFDEPDRSPHTRAAGDPTPWSYDATSRRYRDSSTGRYVGQRQMIELRDTFTAAKREAASDLTARLADGRVNIQQWEVQMRAHIKQTHVDQYVLGKGGRFNTTQADFGRVGREVRDQYGYLSNFARDIADGKLSEAQIAARSRQYIDAATVSYERGRVAAYGAPTLPQYPADGRTQCLGNCKCAWSIVETDNAFECTWILQASAENCIDCRENAARWNPLTLPKAGRSREQVEAELAELVNGHK